MQNYINLNEAFHQSGATSIFPLIGLMVDDGIMDITPVDNPDPKNILGVFEQLLSKDQLFIYKQEDFLAEDQNWSNSDDLNNYIFNFRKENNLGNDFLYGFIIPTEYGNLRYIVESKNTIRFIDLKELPLIETPKQFFSIDKVAYLHIINLGLQKDIAKEILNDVLTSHKPIFYNDSIYILHFLKGSPENMYLNFKDGVMNEKTFMKGEFDLDKAIKDKCLFDFSNENCKLKGNTVNFINNNQYIIDNFIVGKIHQNFDTTYFGNLK
jgi:hypothetical protein